MPVPKGFIDLEAGRRSFLRTAGLGAAATAMFGAASAVSTPAKAADIDVADPELRAEPRISRGGVLPQRRLRRRSRLADITGTGTPGGVSGGTQGALHRPASSRIRPEIANDEKNHVVFLRNALAARPPVLRSTSACSFNGRAAAGLVGRTNFDPYANDFNFLLAAYIFEDVGVTAYHGAAPLITNKHISRRRRRDPRRRGLSRWLDQNRPVLERLSEPDQGDLQSA